MSQAYHEYLNDRAGSRDRSCYFHSPLRTLQCEDGWYQEPGRFHTGSAQGTKNPKVNSILLVFSYLSPLFLPLLGSLLFNPRPLPIVLLGGDQSAER